MLYRSLNLHIYYRSYVVVMIVGNHSKSEELPQCVGCDAPFTVRHSLLECGDFAQVRNNCFHVDNMKELFQDIHIDSIMTFLRHINLFNKI